jgi:glycosyltransferase involved in cell wall biosynthesis
MEKQSNTISYVGFAGVDWWYHNRAHSEFQLLTRLARDHKVLIVNSIGMRLPMPGKTSRPFYKIWRKLKSVARLLKQPDPDLPNLYVYSPLPWPFYGSETGRRFSGWFVRTQVSVAARIADIHDPAIFTTTPTAFPVIAKMKRRCLIYNRSDKHSLYKEANTAILEALERDLLASADLTLYANKSLLAEEQALTKGRAMHLDHGVDSKHFHYLPQHEMPDDLARIPKPIIGFFGNLRSYMVVFSLLARIARDIPEANLVLIGDQQDSTAELQGIKNIHLLGKKSYDEIPSYGAFFDVALIPYHKNEWIRYCNPIKLKEYLALGLMIVSTDYPEAHSYGDRIQIAADADEMVKDIRNCLAHPITPQGRQRLRESVADQTWDERTQRLADYVDDLVRDRTKPATDVAPPAQIDRDSVRS